MWWSSLRVSADDFQGLCGAHEKPGFWQHSRTASAIGAGPFGLNHCMQYCTPSCHSVVCQELSTSSQSDFPGHGLVCDIVGQFRFFLHSNELRPHADTRELFTLCNTEPSLSERSLCMEDTHYLVQHKGVTYLHKPYKPLMHKARHSTFETGRQPLWRAGSR